MSDKIRLGLVGASLSSVWARQSHFPALMASPDVELVAVCTTRSQTAEEARIALGAELAFDDFHKMVESPDIDAVSTVLRVPNHYEPTKAAIAAGKHVYTEWPLGRNTEEATELAELARAAGVQHVVGLQSRVNPALLYVKELLDSGFLGEILTYHVTGFRFDATERTSNQTWAADIRNGQNVMSVKFGHVVDALRFVAGDFESVRALLSTQTPNWYETDTKREVPNTTPDNIMVTGQLHSGAVASVHVAGVPWSGTGFRMEIYGRKGSMIVSNTPSPQRGEPLRVQVSQGSDELTDIEIPDRFTYLPSSFPTGDPFNVGQLYSKFAEAIRTGHSHAPSFDTAVELHRLLDDVTKSSRSKREIQRS